MLLDPRPDLEVAVRIEELRGHRDQLRHLAVIVLELEDLGVALEVVEVVDRAQRELALQISPHDPDFRLVERRAIEELLPLRSELAVVRKREPLENLALLLVQLADRFARLVDLLVGSDFVGADLYVRRERLEHHVRRRPRRRRWRLRGSQSLRRRSRSRTRVERAREPVEELPPGRRQLALGEIASGFALRAVLRAVGPC